MKVIVISRNLFLRLLSSFLIILLSFIMVNAKNDVFPAFLT